MSTKKSPTGIIIWGLISNDQNLMNDVQKELSPQFGSVLLKSDIIPFDYTDYYEQEMGSGLQRMWLMTDKIIDLSHIADTKLHAIEIEKKFQVQSKRRINIDPGFLTLSNFVLATTKNYSHRIYLRDGIFAEVTLIFRNQTFQPLAWTYPDYQNNIRFFNHARQIFQQIEKQHE
ncbi:MAG: DUF4416 family protein [Candidatus Latescibacteria bacterium]|nr:DUF4416 family protein [Candidatus Latescibacterota bacterium]